MKIIEIEKNTNIEKKKKIMSYSIIILIVLLILLVSIYISNRNFREFIDVYIFRKSVSENNLTKINIDENQNNIYAYDKYIAILKDNKLIHYNSSGKEEKTIEIQINDPIIDQNNRFLFIGEKNKQKLYLISSGNQVWEKDIEGNIARVCVNKHGYSAVIISGTTHKSVIEVFDTQGKTIFKTYLSNTTAMDVDISNDNKYMSFAEINTNGTVVSSRIKTVSIEKAKEADKENSSNSIINTYDAKNNSLILNIKYQDGNRLVCMYDNEITVLKDGQETTIIDLNENSKINFADIELNNYALKIIEKSSFLNSQNDIELVNIANKKVNLYKLDGVAKSIYCIESNIAINLGTEVHFIATNGWLLKKYNSNQEIRNIVMNDSFAGIIYRNKIEIVNY